MSGLNFAYSQNPACKQKREMSYLLINKTPISLLQEWLNHLGKSPKYELLQESLSVNNVHSHSFNIRVSVGDISAVGSGKSKKEAKHAAARALLNMLLDSPFSIRRASFAMFEDKNEDTSANKNNEIDNPIGKLQEKCTAKHWVYPNYVLESVEGPPHNRLFVISVEVQNIRETGTGKSKKLAKHEAALKMLQRISSNPIDFVGRTMGPVGKQDHINGFKINYTQLLQDIATKHKFQVQYIEIKDKTPSGLSQCIIRLFTVPITVCRGQGLTTKLAVNNAAMHALDCLSLFFVKKHYFNQFITP